MPGEGPLGPPLFSPNATINPSSASGLPMASPPAAADPSTPPSYGAPPPGYGSPPPNWTPPAGWTPPPGWVPPSAAPMHRPMNWDMISFVTRLVGFTLIFVGALVATAFGSINGGDFTCTSASCVQNFEEAIANSLLAGRVLIALGAFALGAGAGLKLHFALRAPTSGKVEDLSWTIVERLFNYAVLGLSILLLWWVFAQVTLPFSPTTGVGG